MFLTEKVVTRVGRASIRSNKLPSEEAESTREKPRSPTRREGGGWKEREEERKKERKRAKGSVRVELCLNDTSQAAIKM